MHRYLWGIAWERGSLVLCGWSNGIHTLHRSLSLCRGPRDLSARGIAAVSGPDDRPRLVQRTQVSQTVVAELKSRSQELIPSPIPRLEFELKSLKWYWSNELKSRKRKSNSSLGIGSEVSRTQVYPPRFRDLSSNSSLGEVSRTQVYSPIPRLEFELKSHKW